MEIIKGKIKTPMKAVIYGPEGVGKSSLAAAFPKPLFIDVEGGTSRLEVARTKCPGTWAHLKQMIGEFVRDQMGYQTLVIDTADWAEKLAIRQICAEKGFSGLGGNNDYGASYNQLAGMWSDLLTQLETDLIDTGKANVVFLAHSTTKKFELPEEAGQFDRYQLDLEKKVSPLLKAWCHMLLFINYKTVVTVDEKTKSAKGQGGSRRMLYTEHTAAFDAKNRDGLSAELPLSFEPLKGCFPDSYGGTPKPAPVAAPVVGPAPAPAPVAAPPAAETAGPELSTQHKAFVRLMADSGVSYDQVLAVLVARGKYPAGTPIENLDPAFIEGFINPWWTKILEMINTSAAA